MLSCVRLHIFGGNMYSDSRDWHRSNNALIFGVCSGIAERIGTQAWIVRVTWILVILLGGSGIIFYLLAAMILPTEDTLLYHNQPKLLGVCQEISRRTNFSLSIIRMITVLLALSSLGLMVLFYILLYFFMPTGHRREY